ncbi:hypothetical protein [Microbulbifer yueqingensis]|uniref:Uncharacterized protein n=1 Tax=Microbulbifer yueqingensis TaxID=658219 RepID=A0A1G8V7C4_9GAMM|nr:hypothetical protein [Microbulbifer yueqingensis]SDJ62036.1 hypothetical protein SAMN05216212_0441 [Microbulbifer yueqingensis]
MMIRGGLPVVGGAMGMLVISFLGGLFLADYTAIVISYWNMLMQWIHMWVENLVYWVAGPEALTASWQTYDENGDIAKTYYSFDEWYEQEDGGDTVHITPTAFGLGLRNFFDILILGTDKTASVITFMVLYYIAEFTIFFKVLARIARSDEKLPEIKQRFEV